MFRDAFSHTPVSAVKSREFEAHGQVHRRPVLARALRHTLYRPTFLTQPTLERQKKMQLDATYEN
jgi:hypothetical protein